MIFFPRLSCLGLLFLLYFSSVAYSQVAPVQFSINGGVFTAPVTVVLFCPTPGSVIRYTLNGAEPDSSSTIYLDFPLHFDTTVVLRARAFAPDLTYSPVTTHTYFVGLPHTFPVVSLVFEPAAFFDSVMGIYTNYAAELTAVANIEFFENGADAAAFNQLVEVEIQGTASAAQAQKSLEISAKGALGESHVHHPMFPDLPFDKYKRFVLRNGGQDWCVLQFRDAFATSLLNDCSDMGNILQEPALHLQAWRPAVVYLNGQYWGIHNIRERMNRFYVQQHFGWDEEEFDMIENYGGVLTGDSIAWFQLLNYLWQNTDFEDDAKFDFLKQQIDYQNFLDYCIFNVYLENEDWPGNNVRRFRYRGPEGRWQWLTYDLDFTFGLYQPGGGWNTGDASPNALARLLSDTSMLWPNPDWATLLFRRCWENAAFRRDFANRMADMLNTAFLPQRVSNRLDEFRVMYQPEITRHYQRWWFGNYDAHWLNNIEIARQFALNRPAFAQQEILLAVSEAYGLAALTVDAFPPEGGRVEVNTVRPEAAQLPWSGEYFKGVPVPVRAVANLGYKFAGWSKPTLGTTDSVDVLLSEALTLIAHFEKLDTSTTNVFDDKTLSLNLFPNPTAHVLTVCGAALKSGPVQAQILNGLGEILLRGHFAPDAAGQFFIELPDLPGGVYFLKISGEKGDSAVRKFAIAK